MRPVMGAKHGISEENLKLAISHALGSVSVEAAKEADLPWDTIATLAESMPKDL